MTVSTPDYVETAFRLLDLPAEIRTQIYREVLCYDGIAPEVKWQDYGRAVELIYRETPPEPRFTTGIFSDSPRNKSDPHFGSLRLQLDVIKGVRSKCLPHNRKSILATDILNILFTCSQIYSEANVIFWAKNAFIFTHTTAMQYFVHFLGFNQRKLLTKLGIERTIYGSHYLAFDDLRMSWFLSHQLPMSALDWSLGKFTFLIRDSSGTRLDSIAGQDNMCLSPTNTFPTNDVMYREGNVSATKTTFSLYESGSNKSDTVIDILSEALKDARLVQEERARRLLGTWEVKVDTHDADVRYTWLSKTSGHASISRAEVSQMRYEDREWNAMWASGAMWISHYPG